MSNFECSFCGKEILEGEDGNYITSCKHYPLEELNLQAKTDKINILYEMFNLESPKVILNECSIQKNNNISK